ncbi:MAG: type II toxin-antitoxin system ParD family antitoxin [Bryobacterales bacterium]
MSFRLILETVVESQIKTGRYATPNDVLRDALGLLEERDHVLRDQRAEFQRKIQEGVESARRGELYDGEEAAAELEAMLMRREHSGAA